MAVFSRVTTFEAFSLERLKSVDADQIESRYQLFRQIAQFEVI